MEEVIPQGIPCWTASDSRLGEPPPSPPPPPLWATTTRPPPQGSAAPPATRQAAAHRREVGGLRAVKQLRRRGVHCRWRGLEHGLGQVERWTWRWNNFSRGLARPPAPTGRGQRPAEAETQVQAFKTCAIVQKFSEFILISCQARF